MSDSNSQAHTHLLGGKVTIIPKIKEELELDWDQGIIAAAFDGPEGIGIHVCNPTDGRVATALALDGVQLHADTIKLLQGLHQVQLAVLKQSMELF